MNFDCRSLFVGDLPHYCNERDLRMLFQAYQPVLAVHFHSGARSGRDRSYAFVVLSSFAAVEEARKHLDGCIFLGGKIKVRRATTSQSKTMAASSASSVYVRFATNVIDRSVTEFDLHRIFSPVGVVQDVLVKDCQIDYDLHQQYGYAFVHFSTVRSALEAAAQFSNVVVDGLMLHVEPSRSGYCSQQKFSFPQQLGGFPSPNWNASGPGPWAQSMETEERWGGIKDPMLPMNFRGMNQRVLSPRSSDSSLRSEEWAGEQLQDHSKFLNQQFAGELPFSLNQIEESTLWPAYDLSSLVSSHLTFGNEQETLMKVPGAISRNGF
eukprot:scaffold14367_cov250-Ochromonas_danica.AAC.19